MTLTPITNNVNVVPQIIGGAVQPDVRRGSSLSIEDKCGANDIEVSPEALEAKRIEKLVRDLRRQASVSNNDSDERLDDWKSQLYHRQALKRQQTTDMASLTVSRQPGQAQAAHQMRRKSCAVAEFLAAPENLSMRRGSANCLMPVPQPRMYRAHSQQGPANLQLPPAGRMTRAYSHQEDGIATITTVQSPGIIAQQAGKCFRFRMLIDLNNLLEGENR